VETEGLKRYHEENNCLPAKIVVYRDGVGDGQLDIVMDHEVSQLLDSFQKFTGYK
jgi:aubergine-like protein